MVPEEWRKVSVTLVFKQRKKEDSENCRPVSLISTPGKLTEQDILAITSMNAEEKKVWEWTTQIHKGVS